MKRASGTQGQSATQRVAYFTVVNALDFSLVTLGLWDLNLEAALANIQPELRDLWS